MKKALVIALIFVLGLGFAAFAADGLSGTVDFSLSLSPNWGSVVDNCAYSWISISASTELAYTFAGWEFASASGFDNFGYSSQSFTAIGVLGAFSFDTTMAFKPMAVTSSIGHWGSRDGDTGEPYNNAWGDWMPYWEDLDDVTWYNCWTAYCWEPDETTAPVFDDWKAAASVSIAGVSLEAVFFLEGYGGAPASQPYGYYYGTNTQTPSTGYRVYVDDIGIYANTGTGNADPDSLLGDKDTIAHEVEDFPNLEGAVNDLLGVGYIDDEQIVCGFGATPTTTGSGFRFMGSGSAGSMTITSYTYFNLTEAAATAACGTCGYSFARSGTFKIANAGCDVTFTEEYLTVEGFSFGCATVDAALSITCAGFSSIKVLINDFDLGFCCSGITIDGLLTFTTSTKTFTIAPCITMRDTCLDFEVALSYASDKISGLNIYGVSFSQAWNGITFTSKTAFDTDNSCLFGTTGKKIVSGNPGDQVLVMVPLTGLYVQEVDCPDPAGCGSCALTCDKVCIPSLVEDYGDGSQELGFYSPWCFYEEQYVVWEAFTIAVDGDSCCGGAFTFSTTTYFGDKQTLKAAAWHYVFDATAAGDADFDVDYEQLYTWLLAGETFTGLATADDLTTVSLEEELLTSPSATCTEGVAKKAYYRLATQDTLFEWVQSTVDMGIGIGSAWTLSFGLDIDVYGWNGLSIGVGFEF